MEIQLMHRTCLYATKWEAVH